MRRECYWMISKYVKEQKRYTQDELRKIFECTADETVQIIRKLKEYGIVKNVKKSDRQSMLSDLVEEDIRNQYSTICEEFDKRGIDIFCKEIRDKIKKEYLSELE